MPCHFLDEMNSSSSIDVRKSESLQNCTTLNGILSTRRNSLNLEEVPIFENIDPVSISQKRKILDGEKDIEERFYKIQRKKQLQRVAARANLIIADNEDSDEESKLYEQMDWIGKDSIMNFQNFEKNTLGDPIVLLPRFKLKEDRGQLLRISMAKIQGVEDPEVYLRRSVLINNTVKRLQDDGSVGLKPNCHPTASLVQEYVENQNQSMNWELIDSHSSIMCRSQLYSSGPLTFDCPTSVLGTQGTFNFTEPFSQTNTFRNSNFQLCVTFPPENHGAMQTEGGTGHGFANRLSSDDQRTNDSAVSLFFKQPSSMHMFSTQSCSSQYRTIMHDDNIDEYHEPSSSSSLLDSVVYHSLIASLET